MQKDRISGLVQKKNWNLFPNNSGDGECLRLFLLRKKSARKAQASPFDIKTALAGRTLTPMPPVGGELMVELRIIHQRSRLLRGVGRVVPMCAALWADRVSVQVCATQTPRPPSVAA